MREAVKAVCRLIARVLILPFLFHFWIISLLKDRDVALLDSTEALALLPGLAGVYLRRAFLACVLEGCDPSASIGFGTTFSRCGACVGRKVYIGAHCSIGLVTIEPSVLIASGVFVISGAHQHGVSDPTRPIREQPGVYQRVRLGEGCWIGSNAVVMADVGAGSVVAAGAVVTKPVPDAVIVGGVPARVLKSRVAAGTGIMGEPLGAGGDPGSSRA